ncbi:MAG TPA: acyl carrier protein [Candidatus Ornithospirochaeta stercorigallinarum]|nr:acyl carrier protein [Candidatus Ornithospirochaeta stercorigallinarum]
MTENEVFSKVKDLVVEKLSIDPAKITMDANFRKDLGADSLDTYELVYAIEEELGVTISDDMANEFETVGDAVRYLAKELS